MEFNIDRKANFTLKNEGIDIEELELDLIDHGLEEIEADEEEILVVTDFIDSGAMQKALEEKGVEIASVEYVRNPLSTVSLDDEQQELIDKMIERFEDDEDVTQVFTNLE